MKTKRFYRCLPSAILSLAFLPLHAQNGTDSIVEVRDNASYTATIPFRDRIPTPPPDLAIVPMPMFGANPTLGFAFGVMPGLSWYLGSPDDTGMSVGVFTAIYTTNKQFITTFRGNVFTSGDRINLLTDLRFQITSQPTYGLGSGPQSSTYLENSDVHHRDSYRFIPAHQMMAYNYFRLHQTVFFRYRDTRFFFGPGYHLDVIYNIDDHLLDLSAVPPRITHHFYYNTLKGFNTKHYVMSGAALNILYDSRDNTANPYRGRYALINWRVISPAIGSASNSSLLWLEYRDYFNLSARRPRHLIALWVYESSVLWGNLPYMNLPAVGWDMFSRSGRAYTSGRFRGEDLFYAETEYRFPLQRYRETLGGVVFVNAVTASSRTQNLGIFRYVNWAGGVGLRIMVNKRARTNYTIDYAWATNGAQGLYLGLNEVF